MVEYASAARSHEFHASCNNSIPCKVGQILPTFGDNDVVNKVMYLHEVDLLHIFFPLKTTISMP